MMMFNVLTVLYFILIAAAVVIGVWIAVLLIQFLQLRIRQLKREEARLD